MRRELGGVSAAPSPTEEEDDGGSLVLLGIMPLRVEDIEDQLRSTGLLVDDMLGALDRGSDFLGPGRAQADGQEYGGKQTLDHSERGLGFWSRWTKA